MGRQRSYPNVPPPEGSKAGNAYTRFIPREELAGYAAWAPNSFSGNERRAQPRSEPAPSAEQQALLNTVRQAGYQAGYRDGLAALEGFKHSLAQEAAGRFNALAQGFDAQLLKLETELAAQLAQAATLLARQVLRDELALHPEHVLRLANEAVNAVLPSARQISVHLHPEDHALLSESGSEAVAARQARLVSDDSIARGGVLVHSDAGSIDASLDSRFAQAAQSLGQPLSWRGGFDEA
jgi:flagellar assembly protein FliH